MYPIIFKIYGPINIYSYSVALAISVIAIAYFGSKHPIAKKFFPNKSDFLDLLANSVTLAILGGRILHVISEREFYNNFWDMLKIWDGGLSSLGAAIALIIYLPITLARRKIPIFPVMDLAGIYGPLLHSITRIGCFFAGCCWGCKTEVMWAITYTNLDLPGPLNIPIHPTQIYSSIAYFCIFLFTRYMYKNIYRYPGHIAMVYLMLMSLERFCLDFFRGERSLSLNKNSYLYHLSIDQWIAIFIFLGAIFVSYLICLKNKGKKPIKNEPI